MKRYAVLVFSVLLQICLGGVYAWSAFAPPLRSTYSWTSTQAALVFGITIACFTLATIPAGRLLGRLGPRKIAMLGSTLFGLGYLVASISAGRFVGVLAGVGLLAGTGIGLCYVCPLATCMAWFPQHKGTITGLAVAGFGAGALVLSNLAESLLTRGLSVLEIFRLIGLGYGCLALLCAAQLSFPGTMRSTASQHTPLRTLIGQRHFLLLALGMFAGTFGGLLVIGNLKPIALANGLSSAQALTALGVFALGNASGRILWGVIYDRTGRGAIPASLALQAVGVLLLGFSSLPFTFLACTLVAGFAFGGCFVLYATDLVASQGEGSLGTVYPWIFQAYGLSGIVGPAVGGWAQDAFASFLPGILFASALMFAGAVGTWQLGCRKAPSGQNAWRVLWQLGDKMDGS